MHSKSETSNFKLLVTLSNNTEASKRVSAAESLLLLKSQTIFRAQMADFVQCISSKDPLVRSIVDRVLAKQYTHRLGAYVRLSILLQ